MAEIPIHILTMHANFENIDISIHDSSISTLEKLFLLKTRTKPEPLINYSLPTEPYATLISGLC
jgi:hypothetical protein